MGKVFHAGNVQTWIPLCGAGSHHIKTEIVSAKDWNALPREQRCKNCIAVIQKRKKNPKRARNPGAVKLRKPRLGDTVSVFGGRQAKVVKLHGMGTVDAMTPDGQYYRVTGLPIADLNIPATRNRRAKNPSQWVLIATKKGKTFYYAGGARLTTDKPFAMKFASEASAARIKKMILTDFPRSLTAAYQWHVRAA